MEGLQDEFNIIKSFIAITRGGLSTAQLQKEYKAETGTFLNFSKHGFKDLLSMLRACPEIRVYQTPNGPMCEVVDEKMSHITSLVNRTKVPKKRSKKNNNFNRQRRPSFCTIARSSPQRDSKYKSSVAPSSYKQGNTSRNYQDTYRPNYQRQYTQRNYVQYQEKGRSNPQSIAQSTTNSLFSGSKPVKDNQSLNTHVLPKGQSLNKQDPRPNSYQLVSSSSSTKSQSSCNSDPSIGEKSIQVTSQIYNSKPSVSRKNISSDSDWSSDSDTNQEPARVVVSSIKQLHSSKSVQNSTVSSSSRSKAPKKKKYFYERSACSFGARDVRYLSDTNKSNVHSQNLEKAPTPQERHPLIPLIQQQPSSSSFHAKTSAVFPQSASNVVRGSIGSKPKSAVQDGKPYFKTVTHAEKQSCIQTTPDSDKAITVGASPSKRMASATVRNGVPTIVVKVPNRNMVPSEIVERTVLNTCEPMYQGYQFIGDFLLTRVAEVCLTSTIQREGTISYCGLCRDDMTISECEEAIVREGTSGKVVLMIGMTDIMQGSSLEEMKRSTTSLLQRLKYNTVILITLPVPPSFVRVGNEEKLMVLELYNRWLLNLNLPCLIDIDRHLYSDAPFFMRQSYLEGETLSEEGAWVVMDEIVFALR